VGFSAGTVCSWGYSNEELLVKGKTSINDFPVQKSGLSDVSAISAGNGYSLALKR
jgi:hypothetical protein